MSASQEDFLPLQAQTSSLKCGSDIVAPATPLNTGRKRGPVARRRFQKGCFVTESDGRMYSSFYVDADGKSKRVKQFIGKLGEMSERAALREHTRTMEDVNRRRGSVAPAYRGQTFAEITELWRTAIAPNLSPATVRQRECYLRAHVIPRFGDAAPHQLDVAKIQEFATHLRKTHSRKTVINILSAVFSILDYADRCGTQISKVRFGDIQLGASTNHQRGTFLTRAQAVRIIEASPEPYHTMFATAWATGLRAGELLALNVSDLNFEMRTIYVCKSSDDATREIRQPKTQNSTATLPMPSALEATLRNYLKHHWVPNSCDLLFPNRRGTRPRLRDNVVRLGLKPVLRKLNIPDQEVGLRAFRHGLATELANTNTPLPALQAQMRHADVRTTLRVYAHVVQQTQRDAMEGAAISTAIGTAVPIGTATNGQPVWKH
jgi:integrase